MALCTPIALADPRFENSYSEENISASKPITISVSDRNKEFTWLKERAAYLEAERVREAEEARILEEQRLAEEADKARVSYSSSVVSTEGDFRSSGVWNDENYRYTWYSSNDAYHYQTPEWTSGEDRIYRDADGYVVVASSDYAKGTVITGTPFGDVKVYDSGCASGTLDVYTSY